MRIRAIREASVPIGSAMRNAAIAFDTMTASALAIATDAGRIHITREELAAGWPGALACRLRSVASTCARMAGSTCIRP